MVDLQREVYLNPYTDFGFKRLFGSELNKELLISFLNALLQGKEEVEEVTYLNPENVGWNRDLRRAVFDVYCKNSKGEHFIVEMQQASQRFFKDRSVYYSTFPIQEQAQKGDWDYHLKNVYTIGILNFVFPDDEYSPDCYHHEVMLMDTKDNHVFYDKLTLIYLEVPKFTKSEDELETMFDKWMFVFKNLSRLMSRPVALQERVFTRLFEQAEIAQFNETERIEYVQSLKVFRDMNNVIRTAEEKKYAQGLAQGLAQGIEQGLAQGIEQGLAQGIEQGLARGLAQGRFEEKYAIAKSLKSQGIPNEAIVVATGLDVSVIEDL